jgi:predicted RNase H-like HicB family nuclease
MEYLVIIEKTDKNYSAYLPDIPGCVATGDTKEDVLNKLKKALLMHVEGLQEDGLPIPEPVAQSVYVSASN